MSQFAAHIPLTVRRHTALIAALLVAVVIGIVALAVFTGDSSSGSSTSVTQQVGGPNETLRGQAAAQSAGVPSSGGVNETLRGQSAASAASNTP